jgi:hypothetical protein
MTAKLKLQQDGGLVIAAESLGPLLGLPAEQIRLQAVGRALLLCAGPQPGRQDRPMLYGDLRIFSVPELLALISSMQRSGSLTLLVPFARKVIHFLDGCIVGASSDVPDDRLGEVLWRCGQITLEQLSRVHDLVTPQKKLGAVLLENGILNARQLYQGLKNQVLEIVYSTFFFEKGEFVFLQGPPALRTKVNLDLSVRQIIAEGLRRMEDVTRLEDFLPDDQQVLVKRPLSSDTELDAPQKALFELIDGKSSCRQVINLSRLEVEAARQALARLLRRGLVEVRRRQETAPPEPLPEALAHFQQLLQVIHQALAADKPQELQRLQDYLAQPDGTNPHLFQAVGFDAQGRLDVEAVLRNARRLAPQEAQQVALRALKTFYDYALFQAMDVLDDEACEPMMEKLERIKETAQKGKS